MRLTSSPPPSECGQRGQTDGQRAAGREAGPYAAHVRTGRHIARRRAVPFVKTVAVGCPPTYRLTMIETTQTKRQGRAVAVSEDVAPGLTREQTHTKIFTPFGGFHTFCALHTFGSFTAFDGVHAFWPWDHIKMTSILTLKALQRAGRRRSSETIKQPAAIPLHTRLLGAPSLINIKDANNINTIPLRAGGGLGAN